VKLEKTSGKQGPVFAGKQGNANHWRKFWDEVTPEAEFAVYNFHLLCHSCGSASIEPTDLINHWFITNRKTSCSIDK
jgi:hypothetical protein